MQATEGLGQSTGAWRSAVGYIRVQHCSRAGAGSQSVDSVGGPSEAGQAGQADFLGATSRLELDLDLELELESESVSNCQN
jgi:hypothetical protein